MIYRRKPLYVNAFQYGVDDFPEWFIVMLTERLEYSQAIVMHAKSGDYIARANDTLMIISQEVFEQEYEEVEE